MNQIIHHKPVGRHLIRISILVLSVTMPDTFAAEDITGDWEITMEFGGRQMFATLSISQTPNGTYAGKWGSSELSNVRFDGKRLSFTRTITMRDQEFTMNYSATLHGGRLIGLLSSDRGEFAADGARRKPKPPALGTWDMSFRVGDRDITGRLSISQKADGTLDGEWTSERGEHTVSDVKCRDGKLTFSRTSKFGDREWQSEFDGTIKGHQLAGAFKSQRGKMPATGRRVGADLVGKWELTTTSDRGTRTRLLTIFGDLSGRYESLGGEIPIEKVQLDGDQVTFGIERQFGDRSYRTDLKAKLDGQTLKGELVTSRGTSSVTGKKVWAASVLAGTWEFTWESSRGTRSSTLKVEGDMTGTYAMRSNEAALTELRVEGDQVRFSVTMTFGERELPVEFNGVRDGTTLKGRFAMSNRTWEATGRKVD